MAVRARARRLSARIRVKTIASWSAGLAVVAFALISVEAVTVARLGETAVSAPTRLYARAPILQAGQRPDHEAIEAHLAALGYRPAGRRAVGPGEYYLGQRLWVIGRRPFRHGGRVEGDGSIVVRMGFSGRIGRVENAEGTALRYASLEPRLLGHLPAAKRGDERRDRIPVRLSDVPSHLVDAVLTIEDRRFHDHRGLDPRRIAGAALANLRARRIVQGGSTLTQQLARSLYLSPRRSLLRKAREAAMAVVLEVRHDKQEVLEAYLNEIYLGQDGAAGVHGVGLASRHYFGKDVSELELGESALLAGLIRAPSVYSPFRHPESAIARRDFVLERMRERGVANDEAVDAARRAPLALRRPRSTPSGARYFRDYVRTALREDLGNGPLEQGGLAVLTSLDLGLQRDAERAVREGLAELEARYPWLRRRPDSPADLAEGSPLQAALVALDPRTGEVLAMVGGRDYGASQFNRAVQARRQPGSAFKPVVALAALAEPARRDGDRFTLASVLADERFEVETRQGPWRPVNYDGEFRGPVTLREALERSLNVPFARLGVAIGPERIVETARQLGIESPLLAVPSLALGAGEVSLLELTRAFGALAAEGFVADPLPVYGVLGSDGVAVRAHERSGQQAYEPAAAYLVTSGLMGAVEHGTGRGLRAFGFDGEVAAKSGTTNGYRDGWFVAYTPALAVGVWVGFDDGASLERPGAAVALPIVARFLRAAIGPRGASGAQGGYEFRIPAGLEVVEVDPVTGLRAGPGCSGQPELFLEGTAPRESCSPWGTWLAEARRVLGPERRWEGELEQLRDELRRLFERQARVESERRSRIESERRAGTSRGADRRREY